MTKVATTPKFQQILAASGQALLDKRAQSIFKATYNAISDHLSSLNRRKDALELEILDLTDLSVETKDSLRPGSKGYDANAWVAKMIELCTDLTLLEEEIEIAEGIKEEYFSEGTTEEAAK